MFYNGCLSFKKLFGCVQFTVYVYRSIQWGDILHFDHLRFSAVDRMATRAFKAREKKRQQQTDSLGEFICNLRLSCQTIKTSNRQIKQLYAYVANEYTLSFD